MRHTFFCIDGHTAGNPVPLVAGGVPLLRGGSMGERREDFVARFDWIRTGLCFEPRGHDMMSGGFLYPPAREDADIGVLFIETSGCLPMCGHGLIGLVTFGLEHGLIVPREPGALKVERPASLIEVAYAVEGDKVISVRLRNVPAWLAKQGLKLDVPGLGPLTFDVAYGGNFYAIVEPQTGYPRLDPLDASRLVELSRAIRAAARDAYEPASATSLRRCAAGGGGGRTQRRPPWRARHRREPLRHPHRGAVGPACRDGGRLAVGDRFVHESYIGSRFIGRVEAEAEVGDLPAVIPSIEGSATSTGFNTIWIDTADRFHAGFSVT